MGMIMNILETLNTAREVLVAAEEVAETIRVTANLSTEDITICPHMHGGALRFSCWYSSETYNESAIFRVIDGAIENVNTGKYDYMDLGVLKEALTKALDVEVTA